MRGEKLVQVMRKDGTACRPVDGFVDDFETGRISRGRARRGLQSLQVTGSFRERQVATGDEGHEPVSPGCVQEQRPQTRHCEGEATLSRLNRYRRRRAI